MRRLQFGTGGHRDRAGHGRADHQRRDGAQRVAGGIRDGAFGDEGQPEHAGSGGRAAFFDGEAVAEHPGGQRDAQRRGHAGHHGRSHRGIDLAGDQAGGERVGGLVDRPAHVEGHHAAEQQAQQQRAAALHAAQPGGEPGQQVGHRLAEHIHHRQADQQCAQHRQDQHRLEPFQVARQLDVAVERGHAVAGDEAGNDAAEETGIEIGRDQPADHARRDAGAVGDGIGDVTGQRGHHQGEAGLGADLEQRPGQRALVRVVAGIDAAEREGQRDQQAASGDEGQHERHTGHQVLVGAGARIALGVRCGVGARNRSCATVHAGLGQGFLDERRAIVDRRLGAALEQSLATETGQVHFAVGSDDDHVGRADFLVGQCVLRAHRPLRFHAHLVAELLCGLLQAFGGHESVRDAGGAGGDRNDALAACAGCVGRCRCTGWCGGGSELADGGGRVVQYRAQAQMQQLRVAEARGVGIGIADDQDVRGAVGQLGRQCAEHALVAADFDRHAAPGGGGRAAQRFGRQNGFGTAFAGGDDHDGRGHGKTPAVLRSPAQPAGGIRRARRAAAR